MRTVLSLAAFLCAAVSPVFAQTEKGRWMVGGSGAGYFGKNEDDIRFVSVQASPSVGRFVVSNLALGIHAPVWYARTNFPSNFGTNENVSVGLTPFIRYYIGGSQVKPYLQGQAGILRTGLKQSGASSTRDFTNQFIYGGAAGVAFFLNERSSLDISLNYTGSDRDDRFNGFLRTLTTPRTLTLNVGFQLFLGKAK